MQAVTTNGVLAAQETTQTKPTPEQYVQAGDQFMQQEDGIHGAFEYYRKGCFDPLEVIDYCQRAKEHGDEDIQREAELIVSIMELAIQKFSIT